VAFRPQPEESSTPSPLGSGYAGLVLERLMGHASTVLGAESAVLLIGDPLRPGMTITVAGHGVDPDLLGRRRSCGGVEAAALASGRPALLPGPRGRGSAASPLGAGGEIRGVLSVSGVELADPHQLELLTDVGRLASNALDHHARRELTDCDPRPEIDALAGALERLDPQTDLHCEDVARLAQVTGARLGLDPPDLVELDLAARLHDVGKVRVPLELLRKPGPLDDSEWRLMRLHPVWGEEIVAGIPGLEAVALLVRLHHERVDGQGYPDGLTAERIPLASRIVACCDALQAITSDRPYRRRADLDEALGALRAGGGTQLDARVVEALAEVVSGAPARPLQPTAA
jgi:HD-GYP domain-containing protein (c-di-GMP phosphodiesterase class II)